MREALRWIGYLIVTTFAIIAIVFAAYRIRGPSRAQRDALALMEKDYRPKQGTNGFPLLWYMEYDVPADEIATRFAAEVKSAPVSFDLKDEKKPAATRLPEAGGDPARLCERSGAGCLAKVEADPAAMRAVLATYPVIRGRAKAFEAADYYWNDFPAYSIAVLTGTPVVPQRVWLSAYALQYVEGDHAGALAGTCANLGAWRRMHRRTNSLVSSMGAISLAEGAMRLFADELAALPAGEAVPEACRRALEPIEAADVDRCAEMAGEFEFQRRSHVWQSGYDRATSWSERAGSWVLFYTPQWEAWTAEVDARYCEEPPTGMLADVPDRPERTAPNTEKLECISSVMACMLSDIAAPAFDQYDARTLDYAAHLRLAATLLWLRERLGAGPIEERFDERPAALRSAQRHSGYDAKSGTLFVDNMHGSPDEPFRLPVADAGGAP
jgi:hypothetical protein